MSSDEIAIRVQNLSKSYHLYDDPRDRLKQFLFPRMQRLVGRVPKNHFRKFWALKGVSFEVKRGETVGIIGRNGSGKSTLLQLICGTLSPTTGSVETQGRVSALLELGSGFNPEFTGRENIYMNAAVLGLSRKEIDERFEAIAAFADIGDFIEQQVKRYSSGMYIRLAFAVAINVDPEILIVDEALSVGDEAFQRKCFSRIEAIKEKGGTILFVSHSGSAIVELCDRALLLDEGELLVAGIPKIIVSYYQKLIYAPKDRRQEIRGEISSLSGKEKSSPAPSIDHKENIKLATTEPGSRESAQAAYDPSLRPKSTFRYVSKGALIEDARILSFSGSRVNVLNNKEKYIYTYNVRFERPASKVRFGMLIKTINGFELGGAVSAHSFQEGIDFVESGAVYGVEFIFDCSLTPGAYFLNAGVTGFIDETEEYLDRVIDVEMFRVMPADGMVATAVVDFNIKPSIRKR